MKNLIPLHDKVAVISLKSEKKTESGLIITGKATEETPKAKVIAVGPDVTDVVVNDVCYIDWNKAVTTKINDIPVYMLKQEDIIAVIEPDA